MNKNDQKWLVILYTLKEMGGGGVRSNVLKHINECGYWHKNDQNDNVRRTRNEKAWRNDFSFERQHLVSRGYMEEARRGIWKITPRGEERLQELCRQALMEQQGANTFYTEAFLQKLIGGREDGERSEDERLIDSLSHAETPREESLALSEGPRPKGSPAQRSGGRIYPRDPRVSQRALDRAGNLCEMDPEHQSFVRRNGSCLYMEPHHLIPMSMTDIFGVSLDREQNIFCLCSNCHNQIHYGTKSDVRAMLAKLFYARQREICSILGREIDIELLYRIYGCL